jgi:predicted nuclease of predicted toxin-antitoxin system
MTFLLDHCVWRETEDTLRRAGFSCIALRELGKTEAANGELIALAKERKAILLTRDRDFSNLSIYPPGSHEGIILLRITPENMDEVHKVLLKALQTVPFTQIHKNLLIITSTNYRIHKP